MAYNIITLTRGDTYSFDVTLFDERKLTARYEFQKTDVLYFGLMLPGQKFEDAILKKRFTYEDTLYPGRLQIRIAPEDTVDLDPGVYYYMVKLKRTAVDDNGNPYIDVATIINKTKFIIND